MKNHTCTLPNCDRKLRCKGLCGLHYGRLRAHGDPLADVPAKVMAKGSHCCVEFCGEPVRCKGLCSVHYDRLRATGTTDPRQKRTCMVRGCRRKHSGHGFCEAHRRRLMKGDLRPLEPVRLLPKKSERGDIETRLLARSRWTDAGCLEWTGASAEGYGSISWRSKSWPTHRAMWTATVGPIPEGDWTLDHLCYNRACMNIEHLELVTRAENTLRMMLRRYGHVGQLPEPVLEFLRHARDRSSVPQEAERWRSESAINQAVPRSPTNPAA